jgi:hypothetical protein
VSEGGFANARRAIEKHVFRHVSSLAGSVQKYLYIVFNVALSHIIVPYGWAQGSIQLAVWNTERKGLGVRST